LNRDEALHLIHRFHDALNRHDVATLAAFYATDAVVVSPMFNTLYGRDAVRHSYEDLFRLAPDYRVQPDESLFLFEGERASDISTVTATHSNRLFGLAPTGHHIEYQIVRVITFRGSEIAHEQRLYDIAAVLERLEKARMDDELRVAADIQRTLLSRTDHRGDYFEAVGASLPSRSIGGDFFEYLDRPSGAFGVALGDVSGKGPPAALVAAMLQGMFYVEADTDDAPAAMLARLNRALVRRGIDRFATLVFGVLAPDGVFSYSNAGHLPPLLVRTNGMVERLTTGGPPLGVFEQVVFPGGRASLERGDSVVFYSDGVTEARRRGVDEWFGDERLSTLLCEGRALAPAAMIETLFTAVREFADRDVPSDDVTVTVLRYRPPEGGSAV
jgi:serine phosphatase RsbU (regulator of sigma subunit)